MRLKFPLAVSFAVIAAATASACSPSEAPSNSRWAVTATTSPVAAAPTSPASGTESAPDYSRLMLRPEDVSIPPDTFTARSTKLNPDGQAGASSLFVNTDDTRAIANTVLVYPDASTASATLKQASAALSTMVTGGKPQPVPVGTDGSVISGSAPDGSKAVTLLLFTQGRALVRLEFDSAQGEPTSPQMVASIGTMQQIALRVGLPDPA